MRWPDRFDGLALVVGSIMPDLWYVTKGWGYGPLGLELWIDGHQPGGFVQFILVPGVLLTLALRRYTMPVVPLVLPKMGVLRLREYRLLGRSQHRLGKTVLSVAIGGATHLIFDAFTHSDGFFVRNSDLLTGFWFEVGGHSVRTHHIVGGLADVFGSMYSIRLLVRIGRERRQWEWHGRTRRPHRERLLEPAQSTVASLLILGLVSASIYGAIRFEDGFAPALMGASWVMIVFLLIAGAVGLAVDK